VDPVTIDATQWAELIGQLDELRLLARVVAMCVAWRVGQATLDAWFRGKREGNFL
jgi:hypothetical protein